MAGQVRERGILLQRGPARRAGAVTLVPAHKGRVCALGSGPAAFGRGQGAVAALRVMFSVQTGRRGEPSCPAAPHGAGGNGLQEVLCFSC